MKKILITTITVLGLTVSASAANSENYATTFVKENHAVELLKEKIKSSKEIAQKQKMMKEKYTVSTEYKGSTKEEIDASVKRQAKRISQDAKRYFDKKYKDLDANKCSKIKDSQQKEKAICEYKNGNYQGAMNILNKAVFENSNEYAFCVRSMMRLTQADKDMSVISKSNKESLSVMKTFAEKGIKNVSILCAKAFIIGTQK